MGLGDDWNDALLDAIANRSGGTSAYVGLPMMSRAYRDHMNGLNGDVLV